MDSSDVEAEDIAQFRHAIAAGDERSAARLLALRHVRRQVDAPMFEFGQRALHLAAKNVAMLAILLEAGADVSLKSEWANGPYTVLDNATEDTARFLLARGATLTPNVAARLGWLDELQQLVAADPAAVGARGGDGQTPLHEALTIAVADFLLDAGADIDATCVDHRSTPAQYALADRPDVCRRLLDRGARPDIFMAARLGDVDLARRLVDADPSAVSARINHAGYAPVPPMHIYCWRLGFGLLPHDVAARFGHAAVRDLLLAHSPAQVVLVQALLAGRADTAREMLDQQPSLVASLTADEHGHLAHAIFHERFDAASAMLDAGFDPSAPGVDGGTALHAACWVGHVALVERLLAIGRVPVDMRDPTHGSTPLGWAAFGSVHRRTAAGDYPTVAARLVAAGADLTVAGNRNGLSVLEMARGNAAMQSALRRLGDLGPDESR